MIRRLRQHLAMFRLTQAQLRHRKACERLAADVERRRQSEEIISFRVRRNQALRGTRGELA